jgi:hypothetical protein
VKKFCRAATGPTTDNSKRKAVQQLALKIDLNTSQGALLYAAVAGRGILVAAAATATTAKPVPGRHMRKIMVTRDKIDICTNCKYIELLNKAGLEGQVVAV